MRIAGSLLEFQTIIIIITGRLGIRNSRERDENIEKYNDSIKKKKKL